MKSALSDPSLSLAAKGLYAFFLEIGRVASVDEMSAAHPESKYSMTKAMKELKDGHYIKAVRFQQNAGQWNTLLKFTDPSLNIYVPEADTRNTSLLSISSNKTNSYMSSNLGIDTVTNVTVSIGAAPLKEEQMGWNLDGNEDKPVSKSIVRRLAMQQEIDSAPGTVGKIDDRQSRLNKKYKKTNFEAVPASMLRNERPEEEWGTADLVAEFYHLTRNNSDAPAQINGKYLITWINKMVGAGVTRFAILKAMRMFFEDLRNLHNSGIGKPIYQRFMAYYPSVHGLVSRVAEKTILDDDMKTHQEKMLRLLES
jgi:hypothetical protein